jgi:hypothetical protein
VWFCCRRSGLLSPTVTVYPGRRDSSRDRCWPFWSDTSGSDDVTVIGPGYQSCQAKYWPAAFDGSSTQSLFIDCFWGCGWLGRCHTRVIPQYGSSARSFRQWSFRSITPVLTVFYIGVILQPYPIYFPFIFLVCIRVGSYRPCNLGMWRPYAA